MSKLAQSASSFLLLFLRRTHGAAFLRVLGIGAFFATRKFFGIFDIGAFLLSCVQACACPTDEWLPPSRGVGCE